MRAALVVAVGAAALASAADSPVGCLVELKEHDACANRPRCCEAGMYCSGAGFCERGGATASPPQTDVPTSATVVPGGNVVRTRFGVARACRTGVARCAAPCQVPASAHDTAALGLWTLPSADDPDAIDTTVEFLDSTTVQNASACPASVSMVLCDIHEALRRAQLKAHTDEVSFTTALAAYKSLVSFTEGAVPDASGMTRSARRVQLTWNRAAAVCLSGATAVSLTSTPPTMVPPTTAPPSLEPSTLEPPQTPRTLPEVAPMTSLPGTRAPHTHVPVTEARPHRTAAPTGSPSAGALVPNGTDNVSERKTTRTLCAGGHPCVGGHHGGMSQGRGDAVRGIAIAVVALSILAGSPMHATQIAVVAQDCGPLDRSAEMPFVFHPLQFSIGGDYVIGAFVGNVTLMLCAWLVGRVLVECIKALCGARYLDAQGVVNFPSLCLFVYMALFAGTAVAGGALVFTGDAVQRVIGALVLLAGVAVPCKVAADVWHAVPSRAHYRLDEPQQSSRFVAMVGPGEWVSISQEDHVVARYNVVVRSYRENTLWHYPVDFVAITAIGLLAAVPVGSLATCGYVRFAQAAVCLIALGIVARAQPYARRRDTHFVIGIQAMQLIALICFGAGLLSSDPATATPDSEPASRLAGEWVLVLVMIPIIVKVVVDIATGCYIIKLGRRAWHQDSVWHGSSGQKHFSMLCADDSDFETEVELIETRTAQDDETAVSFVAQKVSEKDTPHQTGNSSADAPAGKPTPAEFPCDASTRQLSGVVFVKARSPVTPRRGDAHDPSTSLGGDAGAMLRIDPSDDEAFGPSGQETPVSRSRKSTLSISVPARNNSAANTPLAQNSRQRARRDLLRASLEESTGSSLSVLDALVASPPRHVASPPQPPTHLRSESTSTLLPSASIWRSRNASSPRQMLQSVGSESFGNGVGESGIMRPRRTAGRGTMIVLRNMSKSSSTLLADNRSCSQETATVVTPLRSPFRAPSRTMRASSAGSPKLIAEDLVRVQLASDGAESPASEPPQEVDAKCEREGSDTAPPNGMGLDAPTGAAEVPATPPPDTAVDIKRPARGRTLRTRANAMHLASLVAPHARGSVSGSAANTPVATMASPKRKTTLRGSKPLAAVAAGDTAS